jgi:hypothetical protein
MKLRNRVLIVGAVVMAALVQTAQATTTLGDLITGGTITDGNLTFSDFGFSSSLDTAELTADADSLIVTSYLGGGAHGGVPGAIYLDFSGFIGVNNSGSSSLIGDLKLTYTVTASPGSINYIDQQYTPNAVPTSGQIIIGETVAYQGNNVANSTLTLTPTDLSDPKAEAGDNLYVNPSENVLNVVKDISIAANGGDLVGLSDVEQSFHPVPEPTTVIAGVLLLLPLGASTIRILRRNRIG